MGDLQEKQPSFPLIRKIDAAWFRAEQLLCGFMFLAMSLIAFLGVVRSVFQTRHNPFDAVVLFALAYLAVRTRVRKDGEERPSQGVSVAIAAGITVAVAGVVELYVRMLLGGFIWSAQAALCLMLWVAMLGASIATYEKAHLSLEFGEKIWPARILHLVRALAHAVTSLFILGLLLLSLHSVGEHHDEWIKAGGDGGNFKSMPWLPRYVVHMIFPYLFAAMAVRLLAQTYTVVTKTDEEPEEQLPT